MIYNSLQGIFTTMIGFVTWPPNVQLLGLTRYQSFWSPITIVVSDWPRTFLQPGCFCLAYIYIYLVSHPSLHQLQDQYPVYTNAN